MGLKNLMMMFAAIFEDQKNPVYSRDQVRKKLYNRKKGKALGPGVNSMIISPTERKRRKKRKRVENKSRSMNHRRTG